MTSKPVLLHNPKCSTSRNGLALLTEKGLDFSVRLYLKDVLSEAEIEQIVLANGKDVNLLVRSKEAKYIESMGDKKLTQKRAIRLLLKYPELLERPVLLHGDRVAVGRPIEKMLEIL